MHQSCNPAHTPINPVCFPVCFRFVFDLSSILRFFDLQFTRALPETRSGKIMRRFLRKVAEDDFEELGDTSTMLDPLCVDELIGNRLNRVNSE